MIRQLSISSCIIGIAALLFGAYACNDATIIEPSPDLPFDDTESVGFAMRQNIDEWGASRSGFAENGQPLADRVEAAIPMTGENGEGGKFLFLKVGDIKDSKPEVSPDSRGSEVNSSNVPLHYNNIGITGICFNGDWDNPTDGTEHVYYIVNDCISLIRDIGAGVSDPNGYIYRWKPAEDYYWSGIESDNIRFFAYAPFNSHVEFDTERVLNGESAKFVYTTPQNIKEHVDLSADAITCPGTYRRTVPLRFHHLLAQVNFSVGDPILAGTIHSIKIKGVKSKATYSFNTNTNIVSVSNPETDKSVVYSPGSWSTPTDPTDFELKADIDLPGDMRDPEQGGDHKVFDDGCELNPWYGQGWKPDDKDRPIITSGSYTLFLLPQDLTEDVVVEVQMTLAGTSVPLTFTAPLYTKEHPRWEQGKKYEYMLSNDVLVQYYLYFNSHHNPQKSYPHNTVEQQYMKFYNHDNYTEPYDTLYYMPPYTGENTAHFVQSFAVMTQVKKDGTIVSREREDVEWHPMYCDKDGNKIDKPDWIDFTYDKTGGHLYVHGQRAFLENIHNKKLREAEPVGTRTAPHDLSLDYNGTMTTANTYIINAPGWYQLPLVYGNGMVNGVKNPKSYLVTSAPLMANYHTEDMLYPALVDHQDRDITDPFIQTHLKQRLSGAKIVWQNAYSLVDKDSLELRGDYLVFYVSPETIGQGNSNVAVLDAQGRIAWSWLIWATDFKANAAEGTTRITAATGEAFDFMDVDIGWHYPETDDETGQEREVYLRLIQHRHTSEDKADQDKPFGDNKSEFYTAISKDRLRVRQHLYEVSKSGVAPYYQWGRPTPTAIMPHVRAGGPLHATEGKRAIARRLFNINTVSRELDGYTYENYPLKVVDAASGQFEVEIAKHMTQSVTPGYAIQRPHVFFHYELTAFDGSIDYVGDGYNINSAAVGLTWWGAKNNKPSDNKLPNKTYPSSNASYQAFWNLWCITNDGRTNALTDPNDNIVKTVYDPSPAGFCVPPSRAFDAFTRNNYLIDLTYDGRPEKGHGYSFRADEGEIFFPAMGWLVENYPYTTPSYALCLWPYINFGGELMTWSASAHWYNTEKTGNVPASFHIAYRGIDENGFSTHYTASAIFGQPVRPIREK